MICFPLSRFYLQFLLLTYLFIAVLNKLNNFATHLRRAAYVLQGKCNNKD